MMKAGLLGAFCKEIRSHEQAVIADIADYHHHNPSRFKLLLTNFFWSSKYIGLLIFFTILIYYQPGKFDLSLKFPFI